METPGLVVHGEAEPFSTALRSLINNPQYSDVRFVVGQEQREVFAHRCLLACRCNFFQRLLGMEPGSGVPSPVVLSTVPAEAFLAVLEFLYTNSVKLHYHSVSPMSRGLGGKSWGYKRWEEFMHHVCAEGQGKLPFALQPPTLQVLEVLTAAVEYGLEELREVGVTFGLGPLQERCMTFIEAHSQEVLRTRGFLELSAAALLPLLRSDKLCVDEAELIRAARSWARVGAAVLERPVAEVAAPVVRELRLALLAPAELSALEEQNRREPLIPVRSEEPGGADRGGMEMSCPAERARGPGRPVPPPEGHRAPRASPLSGPAVQVTQRHHLRGTPDLLDRACLKLHLPKRSALGAGFRSRHAWRARRRKERAQSCSELCVWTPGREGAFLC
ncbi:BTB/POZ domain-containing protein 19 isoform X2 [Elephas maximus indicus]|uniref:BTB/POZ domain-containing protein 19 isoform X2 n=1 Tax=Elephas maximus indicus TaxID=99487 RepID=UPI0021169FB8|nr:BTB/POZ domain-containing protein 19 isoform X2 [Elephas maximus indicus]